MDEPVPQRGAGEEGENEFQDNDVQPAWTTQSTAKASRAPKKRKRITDTFEKEVMEVLKSNATQAEQDRDEMFFLSLIPHVKRMCSPDKLNFQIGVMQLLRSYTASKPCTKTPQSFSFISASTSHSSTPSESILNSPNSYPYHSPVQPSISPLTTQPSSAAVNIGTEIESGDSVLSFFNYEKTNFAGCYISCISQFV
jgi:hypothetical protein